MHRIGVLNFSKAQAIRRWRRESSILSPEMKTTPDVFIIESLRFDDEEESRGEGKFLSHILRLSERRYKYYYIRTRSELEEVLDRFETSAFRYLHISCHANQNGIALTLDELSISELGAILQPYLEGRRVFFSACELATDRLARALLKGTGCYSVVAPSQTVNFDEAALFWASLYHLMFKGEKTVMKNADLAKNLEALSSVFGITVRYFTASREATRGFREVTLGR